MSAAASAEQAVRTKMGERVAKLRNKADMTQTRLGHLIDLDQSAVSRIERGDYLTVTPGLVLRICAALECDPDEILVWPANIVAIHAREARREKAVPA